MKKNLLILLATTIYTYTQAQPSRSTECKADSSHVFDWDTTSQTWQHKGRQFMTYDLANNLINEEGLKWIGSAWVTGDYKYSYAYDANNNRISKIEQMWNSGSWVNNAKTVCTYDANNNMTSEENTFWNGTAWVNGSMGSYTYDANNNLTNILFKNWDGSAWINGDQYSLTYDANNNRLSSTPDTNNAGFPLTRYAWTYDANNNKTTELRQIWSSSQWYNFELITYTYTSNQLTSFTSQHWIAGNWGQPGCPTSFSFSGSNLTGVLTQSWDGTSCANSSLITNTYDANNNQTSYTNSNWSNSAWITSYRICASYDSNNNRTDTSFLQASTIGGWFRGDSVHYFTCRNLAAGVDESISTNRFSVSPNPCVAELNINSDGLQIEHIKIYNLDGKLATEVNQLDNTKIDVSSFAKGLYVLEVTSKESVHRTRWVKM